MSINKPRHERSSSMYDKTSLSNTGAQSLRGTFN